MVRMFMGGNCRVCSPMECLLQGEISGYSRTKGILTLGWSSRGHLLCLNIDFRAGVFEDLYEESVCAQKCSLYKSLVKN